MSRAPSTDPDPPSARASRLREEARAAAELFALSGLAIAQPLLDVFGRAPEHFVFRGATGREIILFGLALVLVPAATLWITEAIVGLVSAPARSVLHTIFLWMLAATTAVLFLDGLIGRVPAIVTGATVGLAFAIAHRRTRGPRIWLSFLWPAPVIFLLVFLLASPVAPLLRKPAGTLGVTVDDPTRTVIVIFDELPLATLIDSDAQIDADLFPNFARLADTSTWFRQTTTVSGLTGMAVPSMLTGELPTEGTTAVSSSHPDNLFTLVGGAMPVTASESITRLCPVSVCDQVEPETDALTALFDDAGDVLEQRLSPSPPDVDPLSSMVESGAEPAPIEKDAEYGTFNFAADGGIDRYNRFLDTIGEDAGLHFVHLLLPHTPYRFLPDGTMYPGDGPQPGRDLEGWVDDPTPIRTGMQRHLLQLVWTDALLGQLMDRLEDQGILDSTNLIVTSDHGFAFEPGGPVRGIEYEGKIDDPLDLIPVVWVPFFVKEAGQTTGRIDDEPVRNIDLTPTVADLLGVDIPWPHTGTSAFHGGSGDPNEVGLYVGATSQDASERPLDHAFDRETGWSLLLRDTTSRWAPAADGISGPDRIYRAGPRPELWGEPIPDGATEVDATIAPDSRADDVDPDSGRIPAFFSATVAPDLIGRDVAVTVDGTVWATTTVYELEGDTRADAILPRSAFRPGSNQLAVHLVDES